MKMRGCFEELTSPTSNTNHPKDTLMQDIVKAEMKEYLKACILQEKDSAQNKKSNHRQSNDKDDLFQLNFNFLKPDRAESPIPSKSPIKPNITKKADIYSKEKDRKQSLDKKLEELRYKKAQAELVELKDKPSINIKSKQLSKNRPPLYKRLKEIDIHHKEKLQSIQSNIAQESLRRAQSSRLKAPSKTRRTAAQIPFDQWFEMNNEWENCRKNKLEYLKQEINQFENEKDELLFNPQINPKSKEMIEAKYQSEDRFERLYQCNKNKKAYVERRLKELTPSFTPIINKHYPINKTYYSFMEYDQQQLFNAQFK